MSQAPSIDPDEILRHIVEHPDLYAAEWDLDCMDLKDQLLDMKLEQINQTGQLIDSGQIGSAS